MRPITLLLATLLVSWILTGGAEPDASAASAGQDETPATGEGRAVLITGASSGIGRKTAELLASRGFFVYAGARKQADLEALDALENVQAIRLDVTVPAEIAAAVKTVTDAGRGLYGLINNAGVVVIAPLIEVTEEDLDFQLDVNVYGPYRVTKAFAPLLIESKGRVVTTGSISGVVTWALGGPYTMSKHAIEAYTDVLAMELAPLGVAVSVVDPGNFKSRITANMQKRLIDSGYSAEGSLFEEQMQGLFGMSDDRAGYEEPDAVAEAFLAALTDERPKLRYMVVPNQGEAEFTIRAALQRVVELNQDQPFEYDRDELIELLDEVLARATR